MIQRAFSNTLVRYSVLGTLTLIAVLSGLMLREWTYEGTKPIRFVYDIRRGYRFGSIARDVGLLNVYENVAAQSSDGTYDLDYAPLRLLVMRTWAALRPAENTDTGEWQPGYEFTAPVLRFNNTLELAAAIGVFLLVRSWKLRDPTTRAPWRANFAAAIAALLLWFNPVLLISGHGWPTWDVWVIPFYIFAVLLASEDWWFLSGTVLAIGAMFKGQQLFVAAIFVLWPAFSLRWGAALRWIAGFIFAAAIVVSPWMLTIKADESETAARLINGRALAWVLGVIILSAIATGLVYRVRPDRFRTALYTSAAAIGVALLLCMPWFGASHYWLDIGFGYGLRHHADRLVASLSASLPAILSMKYEWQPDDSLFGMPIKAALTAMYVIGLVGCAIGAAIQYRRNSARFLVAIVAPWLLFYTLMPQMHGRYLIYAAAVGSVLVVLGTGGVLIDLALIAVALMTTLHPMLHAGADRESFPGGDSFWNDHGAQIFQFCSKSLPDVGWAMLFLAGMLLYLSIKPSPLEGFAPPKPSMPSI